MQSCRAMTSSALSTATAVAVAAALALAACAELRLEAPAASTVLLVDGGAERAVNVLRRGDAGVREARVVDVDAAGAGLWAVGEVVGVDAGDGWTNYSAPFLFEKGLGVGRWAFEVIAVDGGVERLEGEWAVAGVVLRRGGELVSGVHRPPLSIGTWADLATEEGGNAVFEFDVEVADAGGMRVEQDDGVVVSAAAVPSADGLDHAQVAGLNVADPGILSVSLARYRVGDGAMEIDVSVAGIDVGGEAAETVVRLAYDTHTAGPPPPVVVVGAGGQVAVGDDGVLEVAAFNLRAPPAEADVAECVLQVGNQSVAWDRARSALEALVDQQIAFDVSGARGRASVACDGREAVVLWERGDRKGVFDYFDIVDPAEGEAGGVDGGSDFKSESEGDQVEADAVGGAESMVDGDREGDDGAAEGDGGTSGSSSGPDGDSNSAGQTADGNGHAGDGEAGTAGAHDTSAESGDASDGRDGGSDDESSGIPEHAGDGNAASVAEAEDSQPVPETVSSPTGEAGVGAETETGTDEETRDNDGKKTSNTTAAVTVLQPPLEEKEGKLRMMSLLRVVSGDPETYAEADAHDMLEAVCHFTEATGCALTNVTKGSAVLHIESYVSKGSESSIYKLRSAIETCALQKRVRVACDEIELLDWTVLSAASSGGNNSGIFGGSGASDAPISVTSIAIAAVVGVMTIILLVVAGAWIVYRRHEEQLESEYSSSGPLGVPESDDALYQQAIVRDIYGRGDSYGGRRVVQQHQHQHRHPRATEVSRGEADAVRDSVKRRLSSSVASSFLRPPSSDFASSAYSV